MTYAVVFDYNGVIANDEHLHQRSFAEVLARFAVELSRQTYDRHFLGRTDHEGLASLAATEEALQGENIAGLVKEKRTIYERLIVTKDVLYPNVERVLRELCSSFKLAIVTGSTAGELLAVLRKHDLERYFTALVTAENASRGKPDPEGYQKSVQLLGIPPESVVAIEDSPPGIRAAKAADLKCIALLHTSAKTVLGEADLIVDTIGDIGAAVIRSVLGGGKSTVPERGGAPGRSAVAMGS